MSTPSLHDDAIVIDGLIIAKWDRSLFEDMRKGGLTAANCTVSVWEDFESTVDNIVSVNQLMRDNAELVRAGYAQASTYPPDVKHQKLLRQLQ